MRRDPFTILESVTRYNIEESTDLNNSIEELISTYESIPMLEDNPIMPLEAIPVINCGGYHTVGIEFLASLVESVSEQNDGAPVDVESAMEALEDVNNLRHGSIKILIEGNDYVAQLIHEAKKAKTPKEKEDAKKAIDTVTKGAKSIKKRAVKMKKKKGSKKDKALDKDMDDVKVKAKKAPKGKKKKAASDDMDDMM